MNTVCIHVCTKQNFLLHLAKFPFIVLYIKKQSFDLQGISALDLTDKAKSMRTDQTTV